MLTEIRAAVRGAAAGAFGNASVNGAGDLISTGGGAYPRYAEMSRRGGGYAVMATSAVAALVVRPTTLAGLSVQNNRSGYVMVVDRLFAHELVTSTTGLGGGAALYAMVSAGAVADLTDAALVISSFQGKPAATKTVLTQAGATVVDNGWFPYGGTVKKESAGAVVPGGVLEALVEGRIIVPYKATLNLTAVSGYAADTFTHGCAWYWARESEYPLE